MPKRTRDYREGLFEDLQAPLEATSYLNAALEDSKETFLSALRDVAESRQLARVAADAGVCRESIYRMLSPSGNPTYASLSAVLSALGLRLFVGPAKTTKELPIDCTADTISAAQEREFGEVKVPADLLTGPKR